jgi:hypothetical protein
VTVQFTDDHGAKVKTNAQAIKNGSVANPYHKSVYGVAYFGEPSDPWNTCKDIYMTWAGMIERVHVIEALDKRPTYRVCGISEDWYCFANFYEWAKQQTGSSNKRWQLDKDILMKGNKLYSKDTCCFVPSDINALFTKRDKERGKYPIGVTLHVGGKFRSGCSNDFKGEPRYIGKLRSTIEEAFADYKQQKEYVIRKRADFYKDKLDPRVYEALYAYQVEITD